MLDLKYRQKTRSLHYQVLTNTGYNLRLYTMTMFTTTTTSTKVKLPTLTLVMTLTCFVMALFSTSAAIPKAKYVIEIPVFVDELAFKNWQERTGKTSFEDLKTEIKRTMRKASIPLEMLGGMKPRIRMGLKVTGVTLLTKEQDPFKKSVVTGRMVWPGQDPVVTTNKEVFAGPDAVFEMFPWLKNTSTSYDLAIVFTGRDLVERQYREGMYFYYDRVAWLYRYAQMCGDKNIGFVELGNAKAKHIDELIAYSLIAFSTSEYDQCTEDGVFKLDSTKVKEFVRCLHVGINDAFTNPKSHLWSCLLDRKDLLKYLPALGETPNQLCHKTRYYAQMNRGAYSSGYGDAFCTSLKCVRKYSRGLQEFDQSNYNKVTPDGMTCGKGKMCYQGKCLGEFAHGNMTVTDSCPWGDQDLKPLNYKDNDLSCQEIAKSGKCEKWKDLCCASCAN